MQNYSPFFGNEDGSISYTVNGIKPKTTNTTFYDSKDVYTTAALASSRAYNIGCSGYRAVITNANGEYKFSPCTNVADYKKIMKEMSKVSVERRYYEFDPNQNIYDIRDNINNNLMQEAEVFSHVPLTHFSSVRFLKSHFS
jgi:hypothetical protein